MVVLIDGDIFRYRCGFAAEKNYYLVELTNANGHKEWKEFETKKDASLYTQRVTSGVKAHCRIWSRREVQPLDHCLQIVKGCLTQTLADIYEKFPNEKIESRIYLSGKENFRDKIAVTKQYKGNREAASKPVYFREIGEYLRDTWSAITTEGIEADDAIGIAAMEAKEKGISSLVVSNDKDLDQIPGDHYNWITKEFYEVSPKEAKTRFFIQLLAGDATDNVPGLPGIGEAKAAKILEGCKSPEEMVDAAAEAFRTHNDIVDQINTGWVPYMLEMANLVYILKNKSQMWIDTKEGIYWDQKYNDILNDGIQQEEKQVKVPASAQRA